MFLSFGKVSEAEVVFPFFAGNGWGKILQLAVNQHRIRHGIFGDLRANFERSVTFFPHRVAELRADLLLQDRSGGDAYQIARFGENLSALRDGHNAEHAWGDDDFRRHRFVPWHPVAVFKGMP